jgi:hypothetical protein
MSGRTDAARYSPVILARAGNSATLRRIKSCSYFASTDSPHPEERPAGPRLEGWAADEVLVATLRDGASRLLRVTCVWSSKRRTTSGNVGEAQGVS